MRSVAVSDLLSLPEGERLRIAQILWDSLAASQSDYPISEAERRELDRRLAAHDLDPEAGSSWPDVRQRLTSQ